jgi:hypothetical protein
MNTRAAIDETMATLRSGKWDISNSYPSCAEHISHLFEMESRIKSEDFTVGKLNRWLGWMQAVIVVCTDATLDEMKEINKRWSDDA